MLRTQSGKPVASSRAPRGLFLLDSEWQTSDVLPQWLEIARHQLPARVLAD